MEKLILKCGRYVPANDVDSAERLASVEAYLALLTQELEHLLGQVELALEEVKAKEEG